MTSPFGICQTGTVERTARFNERQYTIAVIATHPAGEDTKTQGQSYSRDIFGREEKPFFDLDRQLFAAAWLIVAGEKDLETECANLINHFDHAVLEVDRKRIRFPEAPTVTVPSGRQQ